MIELLPVQMVLQSMYICKQPNIGGVIHPHQDTTFLYTDPPSCTAFWIALEDATVENACLWGIPSSHRKYSNHRRYLRKKNAFETYFEGNWADWNLEEILQIDVHISPHFYSIHAGSFVFMLVRMTNKFRSHFKKISIRNLILLCSKSD